VRRPLHRGNERHEERAGLGARGVRGDLGLPSRAVSNYFDLKKSGRGDPLMSGPDAK
jgi:hypothetical protein